MLINGLKLRASSCLSSTSWNMMPHRICLFSPHFITWYIIISNYKYAPTIFSGNPERTKITVTRPLIQNLYYLQLTQFHGHFVSFKKELSTRFVTRELLLSICRFRSCAKVLLLHCDCECECDCDCECEMRRWAWDDSSNGVGFISLNGSRNGPRDGIGAITVGALSLFQPNQWVLFAFC